MRRTLMIAGIVAAMAAPSLASARSYCDQRSHDRKVTGTVLGAVGGALLGNAVSSHGGKTGGTIIGGVAGAAVGSNLAKGPKDCQHAYGYYDNEGRWHDNGVDRSVAYGYYDRNGVWIDGQPNVAGYSADASYTSHMNTRDIDSRIDRIENRIEQARRDGSLSRREAKSAQNTLNDIRRDEQYRRQDGRMSDRDLASLQARLDRLSDQIHFDRQG
jgi:uncharacterized protein YcfJ